MKLTLAFPELDAQRRQMGARLSDWTIGRPMLTPREALLTDLAGGIVIAPSEIEIGPGGLLTYKGEQVILYIKDTQASLWTLQNKPEESRRYHVAECRTLQDMRAKGRFERYVVTNRSTGRFLVDWLDPDTRGRGEIEAELKVCKNCLGVLNYKGYKSESHQSTQGASYTSKDALWTGFDIAEFLRTYATFFQSRPTRAAETARINMYVKDWNRISRDRRKAARWRCKQCEVNLSEHRDILHCHHLNGVVTDNSETNLRVLCALCHAAQPCHGHMRVAAKDKARIKACRVTQGLPMG